MDFAMFNRAAQQQFTDLGRKMWIHFPIGFIDPGNINCPMRVTNKQVFHAGTDIHQVGAGILLQNLPGLLAINGFQFGRHNLTYIKIKMAARPSIF
jgi:hypothetical protein